MTAQRSLALDGIRGVALACPIIVHLGLVGSDRGLWLAIGMFFTLSAFLVTNLALREIDRTGRLSLAQFWVRRIRRLLPASLLVLALVVTTAVLTDWPGLAALRGDVLSALAWGSNWEQLWGGGYWDAFAPSLTHHFWSLSFEEQVYLVFPLLVIGLVMMRSRSSVAGRLGVAATVMIAVSWWLLWTIDDASTLYLSSFTRLGEIGFGILAACLHHSHSTPRLSVRFASLLTTGFLLAASPFWIFAAGDTVNGVRWGITGSTPLMAAVITILWRHPTSLPARFFALRVPAWLGRRSYGIYLLHLPLIEFASLWTKHERLSWWTMIAVVVVTIAGAAAMFRWFEEPLRTGVVGKSDRRAISAFLVGVVVIVATTIPLTRPDSHVMAIDAPASPPSTFAIDPLPTDDGEVPEDSHPTVLVIGDSTAWVTRAAVEGALAPIGYDTYGIHMVGCPFGGDVRIKTSVMGGAVGIREIGEEAGCDQWWDDLLPQWLRTVDPDIVIVVGGYALAWEADPNGDDEWCRLGDGSGRCEEWAGARLRATTERIDELTSDAKVLYTTAGHVDPWGPLDIPKPAIDALNELIVAEVERADLDLVDLGSWLDDHLDLTVDGTHLGADGITALIPWLREVLPPVFAR